MHVCIVMLIYMYVIYTCTCSGELKGCVHVYICRVALCCVRMTEGVCVCICTHVHCMNYQDVLWLDFYTCTCNWAKCRRILCAFVVLICICSCIYIFNICSQGGVRLNVCLPCPPPDGSLLHLHFSSDTATDTTDTTNTADSILHGGIDDVVELTRDEAQINVYSATVPGELILTHITHV